MWDFLFSWTGWQRDFWLASGADVGFMDGMPPEDLLALSASEGFFEVLFCYSGSLCLELAERRELHLNRGQILFLPGNTKSCCRFSKCPFRGILVRETEKGALSSLAQLWLSLGMPQLGCSCMIVEAAFWNEAMFFSLEKLPLERKGNYCIIKILELLYLSHAAGAKQPDFVTYYDRYQLQTVHRIHDYLLEHLDQSISIIQLSRQFHISSTALKSCFRQIYGASVHQYILGRRMEWAAQLLSATDQTVLQIAETVGYSSVSQFSSAFKARYQLPPSRFRREIRKMSFSAGFSPNQVENHDES